MIGKSLLVQLLEGMTGRRGVMYLAARRAVERYVRECSEETFRGDVAHLTDSAQIGQLLSIGLRKWQLDMLTEATERRG